MQKKRKLLGKCFLLVSFIFLVTFQVFVVAQASKVNDQVLLASADNEPDENEGDGEETGEEGTEEEQWDETIGDAFQREEGKYVLEVPDAETISEYDKNPLPDFLKGVNLNFSLISGLYTTLTAICILMLLICLLACLTQRKESRFDYFKLQAIRVFKVYVTLLVIVSVALTVIQYVM